MELLSEQGSDDQKKISISVSHLVFYYCILCL